MASLLTARTNELLDVDSRGFLTGIDSRIERDADRVHMSFIRLSVEQQLPLADSVIVATARQYDAALWTQDADFEGLGKAQLSKTVAEIVG